MSSAVIRNDHSTEWYSEVPRSILSFSLGGLLLLLVTFGLGGVWAATAPLAAAIVAQGTFVATGSNKIVQHLEGGVIERLLVGEGDYVRRGDVLVRLDKTAAAANERALNLRRYRLETVVARLRAQAEGAEHFQTPEIVLGAAHDPDVVGIIESQKVVFNGALVKLKDQLNLINRNIRSLEYRSKGYEIQKTAFEKQLALLQEEEVAKSKLLKRGYISKIEVMAVRRSIADAIGDIGRLDAEIQESSAEIAKFEQQATIAINANRQAAVDALEAAESDLSNVREEIRAAKGVLERTTIRSPVSGTVVRTYYHTSGGVVTTGKPIMEILPANVPLIIEARISRSSIDQVRDGQEATIRLSSLDRRTTPVLAGKVFYISADSVEDDVNGPQRDIYIVRVQVSDREIRKLSGFRPVPGMPADVLIQTNERTFFDYLAKPIQDSMSRAFRER